MPYALLLLVCSISIGGQSQLRLYNSSLTDSTLPYLYTGVDNVVQVDWKGLEPANHVVSISGGGGSIRRDDTKRYLVHVNTITDECHIRITNKSSKEILHKVFKVRHIPYPAQATLAGFKDTTISKQRVFLNPFLTVILKDCFFKMNYMVLSFSMTAIYENDTIAVQAEGNRLSKEQLKLVQQAKAGTKLLFDDIRATGPDTRAFKLAPFWIKIE